MEENHRAGGLEPAAQVEDSELLQTLQRSGAPGQQEGQEH